jgi:hypothetical protein
MDHSAARAARLHHTYQALSHFISRLPSRINDLEALDWRFDISTESRDYRYSIVVRGRDPNGRALEPQRQLSRLYDDPRPFPRELSERTSTESAPTKGMKDNSSARDDIADTRTHRPIKRFLFIPHRKRMNAAFEDSTRTPSLPK